MIDSLDTIMNDVMSCTKYVAISDHSYRGYFMNEVWGGMK